MFLLLLPFGAPEYLNIVWVINMQMLFEICMFI